VGGRLAALLGEELLVSETKNVTIICLVRASSDTTQLARFCRQGLYQGIVEVRTIELSDLKQLRTLPLEKVTYIYHCAAKGGDWGDKQEFVEANVHATQNMIQIASECPRLKRFLHVSTVDVYPHLPPCQCNEDVPPVKKSRYHYTTTKAEAERIVTASNVPWTIVRPAVVYGPHSYTWGLQEAILIEQGKGVLVDNARYRNGAIYIDDLVEAIIAASRSDRSLRKSYNIANPNSSGTWKDFYDKIADIVEKPRVTFSVPFWLAYIVTFLLELVWRICRFSSRPLLTFFLLRLIGHDQDWPIQRAQEDFGWEPQTPLAEGLDHMGKWLTSTQVYKDVEYLH